MVNQVLTFGARVCGLRTAFDVGTSSGTVTVSLGCALCAGAAILLWAGNDDAKAEPRIVTIPKFVFRTPPAFLSGN